ncbi:DUF7709 family protein [Metapseudomonas boanensis]
MAYSSSNEPAITIPGQHPGLFHINSKISAAGESLPAVALKDRSKVQTGIAAAMLQNVPAKTSVSAVRWHAIWKQPCRTC